MTEYKPGQKVRRTDPESSTYCYFGEVATLVDLFDDTPCWNVLRSTGEKVEWDEDNFELVLTPADLGNHVDFDAMQPELHEGDRVFAEGFGNGEIIRFLAPETGVVVVCMDQFSELIHPGDDPEIFIALNFLSKIEPESKFSELATFLALGMYERKVWHGQNMTSAEMDVANNATAEYLAEQLEDAGYTKSTTSSLQPVEDAGLLLNEYQRSNLLAALLAIAGHAGPSPLSAANTGDWVMELVSKLGWNPRDLKTLGQPNLSHVGIVAQFRESKPVEDSERVKAIREFVVQEQEQVRLAAFDRILAFIDNGLEPLKEPEAEPLCTGCGALASKCGPRLWRQQKKCCPTCSHTAAWYEAFTELEGEEPPWQREENAEIHHCNGCGDDYNLLEESHVGHEADPQLEAEEQPCEHCGYSNNAHALGCISLTGNFMYHAGIVIQEEPDKTLREKLLTQYGNLEERLPIGDVLDEALYVFREHYNSKREEIKYAFEVCAKGYNAPDFDREAEFIETLLFGDEN